MRIEDFRKDQLLENYKQVIGCTYSEWLQLEADSDPSFFRWLFDDESLPDFAEGSLSPSQREAWKDLVSEAEDLTLGDYAEHFDVDTEDESLIYPIRSAHGYYWLTGAELEALWDRHAIRVEYADVTDADRWEARGGDHVDMENDFVWIKTAAYEFIGLF